MSLISYVDESGTHDDTGLQPGSEVAGVFGYIATKEQWQIFGEEWQAALNKFGVCVFHSYDFARPDAQTNARSAYYQWTDKKCEAFIRTLIEIARENTYFGIGGVLDMRAYDSIVPAELKTEVVTAYHFCFQLFLDTTIYTANTNLDPPLADDQKIDFFFDQKEEIEKHAIKNFKAVSLLRPQPNRLGTIAYGSKEDWLPLQAADLLAFVLRQSASRKLMKGDWAIKPGGWEADLRSKENIRVSYHDAETIQKMLRERDWI